MGKLNKYKDAFLSEAKEYLDLMNKSLLGLEKSPGNIELVNNIFRASHSLKGMAATMQYDKTAALCHAMEDVLDSIKKKKIKLEKCTDLLFKCFDALELSLKEISKDKEELDTDGLVQRLKELATAKNKEKNKEDKETTGAPAENSALSSAAVEKITSIEVKLERLDLLMNLAEELLINKMRLDRIKEDLQNPELTAAVDTMGRLITDLQFNVIQSRMVPIGFVFNRFPRMVRDLAKQQRKEVNLQMEGSDLELDKAVVDELGECLVHLLRNAVDHGIETPEERKKAGKPPQGTIELAAIRTKNFATIEVADDGAGLDLENIRNVAAARGILSQEATPEEIMSFIFSGVSTTRKVTAVSGRGFGLNIVKEKVQSLGGAIKAESESQKGTKFVIEVPLTLAIIRALLVEVGSTIHAIPLANIERLVTVDRGDVKGMLNYEAVVLDEEDIPITRLDVLFGTPSLALERQPIVIIRKGEENLGLAVDAFMNTQEIVIRPLDRLVRENRYFAGSTIIGMGEVVLVLDVANLILSKRTAIAESVKK